MSAVRVAVNLLWLAPGRVGGSEQYLVRQLAGLAQLDGGDQGLEVELYAQPALCSAHPELCARFAVHSMPLHRDWRPLRMIGEHTWLARRTRAASVVHHGGGTLPLGARRPAIVTIHDVQYLSHPGHFSAPRLAYLRAMVPRSVTRATLITCPSHYVRSTLIERFGIAGERVVVVPHGVPALRRPSDDAVSAVRASFGLGALPYVIYPAITHPHKRHTIVIDVLRRTPDLVAVLPGGEGRAEPALREAIAAAGLGDRVVRPGRVSDDDRDALVAGAEALVFPSEYEGFGAPLIEAMQLGTPVVCGDHPAIREVVGGAALVVAEDRTSDATADRWAEAIARARVEHDALVAAGVERAVAFTIERSGAALRDVYRRAAS